MLLIYFWLAFSLLLTCLGLLLACFWFTFSLCFSLILALLLPCLHMNIGQQRVCCHLNAPPYSANSGRVLNGLWHIKAYGILRLYGISRLNGISRPNRIYSCTSNNGILRLNDISRLNGISRLNHILRLDGISRLNRIYSYTAVQLHRQYWHIKA